MRRITAFSVSAAAALSLCSCTMPQTAKTDKPNGLAQSFSSDVTLEIGELDAEGKICRYGTGMWDAEFTAPNTLSGVKLEFSEGNVNASYKGLSFSVPKSAVPVKAMLLNLMSAVDDLAANPKLSGEPENGLLKITGRLEGGEYILTADENGNITAFEMPENSLKINFSEIVPIESASEAETTAESEEAQEETSETAETSAEASQSLSE